MRSRGLFIRRLNSLQDERGFTIIEAMAAMTILTIGAFAVAQSLGFGLKATGISRQRTGAEAIVQKDMEYVRSLDYLDVGLADEGRNISHSTNPENPNYWVNSDDIDFPTYDADGAGTKNSYEPLITAQPDPSVAHLINEQDVGSDFRVYEYVTWVDISADGIGVADDPNGDGNDQTIDGNGHDAKRVTIVVTWDDPFRANHVNTYKASSLFSFGQISFGNVNALPNQPPTVDCPTTSTLTSPVGFTATAADPDGTITQVDWDFGDGQTSSGSSLGATHTYAPAADNPHLYTVIVTVTDDEGLSTSTSGCTYNVLVPVNTNEVEVLTLTGATGGTFTLTFGGQTTGAIAWNAPASGPNSVQKALKQLSNVTSGDITVTGSPGGPYTLTFGGAYGDTDINPPITCTKSTTPGTSTCVVTTTTQGVDAGGGGGGTTARPSGTVTINAGALNTKTSLVTLALSAAPGTTGSAIQYMRTSETGEEQDYGAWVAYSTSISYTFSPTTTQGTRYVYVQYKDAGGRISEDASDSIFLDSVLPGAFTLGLPARGNGLNKTKVSMSWTTSTDPAPSSGTITYYPEYKKTTDLTWLTSVPGCGSRTTTSITAGAPCTPIPTGSPQYNFRIRAQDPAGNIRYSNTVTAPAN